MSYDEALAAYNAGNMHLARTLGQRCLAGEPSLEEQAQVLYLDGCAARRIGDLGEALGRFEAVERLVAEMPSLSATMTGKTAYAKGLTLWQRKKFAEAATCYQVAQEEFANQSRWVNWRQAGQNRAWALVDLGHYIQAQQALDEVIVEVQGTELHLNQLLTQAYISVKQRINVPPALDALTAAIHDASSANVKCLAAAIGAEAALQDGRIAEALALSDKSVSEAAKVNDDRASSLAYRTRHTVVTAAFEAGLLGVKEEE